ncbi:MAG: PAS domain S-box protein, partial [Cyclobacteriaceae bacterium]|nr:PAS domain S-box protein [Cyclobacteriaceae bacterium]
DYDAVIKDLRLKGKKTFIYRAYKKNREEIIFRANSKIVKRNGREYIQTFAQEITERIKAENTLKFQSQIIDQIHDSVVSTDLEGIVTSWNQGAEKMFGYHKEEMIGNSISQLYPEEDYSLFMNNIISPLKERGQLEAEVRMRRKSGSIFYGNLSLSLMRNTEGKAIGMVGYTMDISDRKKAEEEISIARDEYKSITNLIVDIIVKVNMEGKFVFVNSGAITFYGMDEEKLLQHNFRDFIHPEDLEISDVSFRELLAHKRVTGFTNRHKNPTGWSMIEWYATPVFNEHDEFNGVLATGRDITERKLTEDALQSVSLINEKIISESPIGISIYDPSGQCISSNDSMAQIVGATKEQVLSQNYNNIESWKKSGLLDKVKSALDSHQKVQYEFTITTTFGKTVSLECFLVPFSMQNKTHLLLMTDDITERKQQEEEIRSLNTELEKRVQQRTNALEETLKKLKDAQSHLVHTEKMASLGQLTAGIGHEINNPVNFINAGIHSLENNLKEVLEVVDKYRSINQDNAAELIREIEDNKRDIEYETALKFVNKSIVNIKNGVERTTQIINGLRTFSRNDNEQAALIDIHENIEATLIMLHAKYANKVTLKKCFVNLPRVECLAGKINQVLANIIGNGIDAVIENQGPDTAEINITTSMKNNEIIIEIKDNGPGMDEETLKKIFDPFYTTKEIGKGTGLGLSISYNIIKQHSGKLLVKSSLGRGTTFTVCLPLKFRGERVHN